MEAALDVRDLSVSYGSRRALEGVSFSLPAGAAMAVIGPNGSGKSTLLQAIVGLAPTDSGRIDTGDAAVALVLQSTDVDRSVPITVADTVAMARYANLGLLRRFGEVDRTAVRRAMERLEVADLADRQLHALSGGQRQRVLVAQGLAQEAPILLLDEPVTGLDVVSREVILDVIDQEREDGRTLVVTTHNLEEARRADQVMLLDTRAVAVGSPDEVLSEGPLREAFGGRVMRMGDGFVMDDPHHHHHVR